MGHIPSPGSKPPRYAAGQRLICEQCGTEIEIISPCTCDPPNQVFQCCSKDMKPSTGRDIHLGDE